MTGTEPPGLLVPRGAGVGAPPAAPGLPAVEVKLVTDAFSMVEYVVPAGFSPPPRLHRQTREDTTVYVVSGQVHYWFVDRDVVAHEGTAVHLPRNSWSRWANDSDQPCRLLAMFSPAGFEQYFLDLAEAVAAAGGDRAALGPAIATLRRRYGDEDRP